MKTFRSIFCVIAIFGFLACTKQPAHYESISEKGMALVAAKNCRTCHSIDGSRLVGPSFKAIYGTEVKLANGTLVKVDDSYIRESIEDPMIKIVDGYSPSMPVYKGMINDEEMMAITEYIKSLK